MKQIIPRGKNINRQTWYCHDIVHERGCPHRFVGIEIPVRSQLEVHAEIDNLMKSAPPKMKKRVIKRVRI